MPDNDFKFMLNAIRNAPGRMDSLAFLDSICNSYKERYYVLNDDYTASLFNYQAEIAGQSFLNLFWNGTYLNDYVFVDYRNREVRPNQLLAVSLPFSPLDKKQQKLVLDICTKELLTPKGLRTLSPKSGIYNPHSEGSEQE